MKRNQGPNGLHRVLYVKNFLTGTLAGLQVRCSYTVPAADCHTHQLRLNDFTRENPGSDAITGAAWFTSGVGCEEVHPLLDSKSHALAIVRNRIDDLKYSKPAKWRDGVTLLRHIEQHLAEVA